jgi:hypothetical protein
MNIELHELPDEKFGFPYPPKERDDDTNHGYFDLKRNPGKIPEIPEVQHWPELREFLTSVNDPRSLYRTLGCAVGVAQSDDSAYQIKVGGYVDIAIEVLGFNTTKENFIDLVNQFAAYVDPPKQPMNIFIRFNVTPTVFGDHKMKGWSLNTYIWGYGQSETEAREMWVVGLRLFQDFLNETSLLWEEELHRGRDTIS